jgi:prefoldin alpha subunit
LSEATGDDEKLSSLLVEVRVLESTFNELTSRQTLLERALLETRSALDAVKGLNESPPDEVLMQIGGGAMLRGPPPTAEKVLVNVGSSVVVEKSREEAVELLEARSKEMEVTIVSIVKQRNEIAERLESDRQLLQSLLARQKD